MHSKLEKLVGKDSVALILGDNFFMGKACLIIKENCEFKKGQQFSFIQ